MNTIVIENAGKILKKNIRCVIIMIVLVSISFYLLGVSLMSKSRTNEAKDSFEETYGNQTIYYTGEFLTDEAFYHYREEDNTAELDQFKIFMSKLENCDDFSFISLMNQPIQIVETKIPEVFLDNYETGMSGSSVSTFNGETLYTTKSLSVTQSFFDSFSIKIEEGRGFSKEDYLYDLNQKTDIPVILGHEYKSVFNIGDRFDAYFLGDPFHFVVVGMMDDEAFFYDRNSSNMVSCNRYIILPAFYTNSYDDFSKIMTMQRTHGIIFSSIGYKETTDIFKQYQDEVGLSYWDLYCSYPEGNEESTNIFQMYSAMTSEVSKQFRIIVILIMLFGSVSIITMICSMLRENRTNFGIELLCGSSLKRISAQAFLMISSVILTGDILALPMILLGNIGIKAFLIVQLMAILISVVSGSICAIYAKKMDLSSIIGGKE